MVILATFLALPLLAPGAAFAQTEAEKAADLYKAGIDLYFAEDYGLAITKFRAGYQLDPNAMFLYSLSLCFSKLGNFQEALENAQQAAEIGGMPADAETKNKARLDAFSVLIKSESLVAEAAAAKKEDGPATCATNADCSDGEICNIRRGLCVAELPPSEPSEQLFTPVGWAGVGLGAVGVGMLVGGGFTSLAVKKNEDRYAVVSDPGNPEFDATERDDLESKLSGQKSLGKVLILGGAGAVVVGGALVAVDLFVLKKGDDQTAALLVPTVAPGYVGLSWGLRY